MNRRIFAILFISVFLIASIGFISAEENNGDVVNASHSIKVKIVWDDNGNTTNRPDKVLVNLLDNGILIESLELNQSNLWNATFQTQNDGGEYKVKLADDLSNYSVSYNGSAEKGFIINCTLNKTPLKVSGNESSLEKNDTKNATNNQTNNNTVNNKTNKTQDNNKTNKTVNPDSNKSKENLTPVKEEPKNDIKLPENKKPTNKNGEPQFSINKLRNTGLPIIVVSLIAIFGGYAYLRYRK